MEWHTCWRELYRTIRENDSDKDSPDLRCLGSNSLEADWDFWCLIIGEEGFAGGSDGKGSTCSAADLGSIPWSLGWKDPLEEGTATNSSILAWRIPMDRRAWQAIVHDVTKSQTQLRDLSTVGRKLTPAPKEQPCQINQIQIWSFIYLPLHRKNSRQRDRMNVTREKNQLNPGCWRPCKIKSQTYLPASARKTCEWRQM